MRRYATVLGLVAVLTLIISTWVIQYQDGSPSTPGEIRALSPLERGLAATVVLAVTGTWITIAAYRFVWLSEKPYPTR